MNMEVSEFRGTFLGVLIRKESWFWSPYENPHMVSSQNYGPNLGTLNSRDRLVATTHKRDPILGN